LKTPGIGKAVRPIPASGRLTRDHWVSTARDALIKGGIHAVKIDLIANRLKITRGSFYWHFSDRADLLSALLELWHVQNTEPFEKIAHETALAAADKYLRIVNLWVEEKDFDPAFDSAVRDWARASKKVASAVDAIDTLRMKLFEDVFREMGYPPQEAMVRARITYYHQVGYYALAVKESKAARHKLLPLYLDVLMGPRVRKG
jgi:AcrR family transcriptional regulator